MTKLLSKTKYLIGLQCPKYLWIQSNNPERIPETDPVTQYIFDQGHLVGELARKLFPGGIDIPTDDFMGNINQTKELLEQRKPLFEAGILAEGIYSRVDILNPSNPEQVTRHIFPDYDGLIRHPGLIDIHLTLDEVLACP